MRMIAVFLMMILPSLTASAQTVSQPPGDLFPKVKPRFVSATEATAEMASAPLASAEDTAAFDQAYGPIVKDALAGKADDRQATAELLTRKAQTAKSGLKRLLLAQAFALGRDAGLNADQRRAAAEALLATLDEPSIAVLKVKTETLCEIHTLIKDGDPRYSSDAIADAYLALAELQYRVGDAAAATVAVDAGESWAKNNAKYYANVQEQIAAFRKRVLGDAELEKSLIANPANPDANLKKAFALLGAGKLQLAAPHLQKATQKEFNRVGSILQRKQVGVADRIELANSINDCLPLATGDQQLVLAFLLYGQVRDVLADKAATETDRSRAEILGIKAEKILGPGKAKVGAVLAASGTTAMPEVKFFGIASSGRKIVYVCDHSGSMLDCMDFLRNEVANSVISLDAKASFAVVFFSEKPDALTPMTTATAAAKRALIPWLDKVKAQGENDDLLDPFEAAMKGAISLNPDTIYFLTDGNFNRRLVERVRSLNPGKKVRINTIAFVKITQESEASLKQIALDNGGTFAFITAKQLSSPKTKESLLALIPTEDPTPPATTGPQRTIRAFSPLLETMPRELRPNPKTGWDDFGTAQAQDWITKTIQGQTLEIALPLERAEVQALTTTDGKTEYIIRLSFRALPFRWNGAAYDLRLVNSGMVATMTLHGEDAAARRWNAAKAGMPVQIKATMGPVTVAGRLPTPDEAKDSTLKNTRGYSLHVDTKDLGLADH